MATSVYWKHNEKKYCKGSLPDGTILFRERMRRVGGHIYRTIARFSSFETSAAHEFGKTIGHG